jgi:hypothetical protein
MLMGLQKVVAASAPKAAEVSTSAQLTSIMSQLVFILFPCQNNASMLGLLKRPLFSPIDESDTCNSKRKWQKFESMQRLPCDNRDKSTITQTKPPLLEQLGLFMFPHDFNLFSVVSLEYKNVVFQVHTIQLCGIVRQVISTLTMIWRSKECLALSLTVGPPVFVQVGNFVQPMIFEQVHRKVRHLQL